MSSPFYQLRFGIYLENEAYLKGGAAGSCEPVGGKAGLHLPTISKK